MRWRDFGCLIDRASRRRQLERETDDELRFHLEARADDLMVRRGLSRDDAVRQSRLAKRDPWSPSCARLPAR